MELHQLSHLGHTLTQWDKNKTTGVHEGIFPKSMAGRNNAMLYLLLLYYLRYMLNKFCWIIKIDINQNVMYISSEEYSYNWMAHPSLLFIDS